MTTTKLFRVLRVKDFSLLAAMSVLIVIPASSYAAQFVLFDVTFTYTKMDADNSTPSKSHYYVRENALNPDRPRDWTAPVDYRNGTVHIRAEVIGKPPGRRANNLDTLLHPESRAGKRLRLYRHWHLP